MPGGAAVKGAEKLYNERKGGNGAAAGGKPNIVSLGNGQPKGAVTNMPSSNK